MILGAFLVPPSYLDRAKDNAVLMGASTTCSDAIAYIRVYALANRSRTMSIFLPIYFGVRAVDYQRIDSDKPPAGLFGLLYRLHC